MTLKLQKQELHAFIRTLMSEIGTLHFETEYERNLSRVLLRELLEHLTKRALSDKPKYSIKISDLHVYLLNEILWNTQATTPYENAVILMIYQQIDKECLKLNTQYNLRDKMQLY